jgi:hypothetical protein
VARVYSDDYCSTECAKKSSGVAGLDERRRLGVPPDHDLYQSARRFAHDLGLGRVEFWRLRRNQLPTQPGSLANLQLLRRPGWFSTVTTSWQAVRTRLQTWQETWTHARTRNLQPPRGKDE